MFKKIDKALFKQIAASELRSEEDIIASWQSDIEKPLLSINCITYNHEPYIEDALIGFLRQETDFPIEILVHDDASTDGTPDIIRKYEKLYPRIIKPIYQAENQYSKGLRLMPFNAQRALGEYIAVCEGDDYWIDSSKLHKQVTFLQKHKEYVISGHDAFIIDESGEIQSESKLPFSHKRDFSGEDLSKGKAWLLTMSWVYRNVFHESAPERNMVKNGDIFFTSLLGRFGGSHHHTDIKPAAYRVHSGGVWSFVSSDVKQDETINTYFWMYRYYKRVGDNQLSEYYLRTIQLKVLGDASFNVIIREMFARVFFIRQIKTLARKILGIKRFYKLKRFFRLN